MAEARAMRVAVVGSGPAGMYAAAHLLGAIGETMIDGRTQRLTTGAVEVDMFERLPSPHGLVRGGVAPDHAEKKLISHLFESVASRPEFRFRGNVEVGRDITADELSEWFDAVVYAIGASDDAKLGVPGEHLNGCISAREFVGWYNGHPDHVGLEVNLRCERAVIVGNGNVALDAARVLSLPVQELEKTDIADHALGALRDSSIREVVVLGRRSHLNAAFANPELEELENLADVDILVDPEELALAAGAPGGSATRRKVETLHRYASAPRRTARRRVRLRFLLSPVELTGSVDIEGIRLARNEVVEYGSGVERVARTDTQETIPAGLVIRSIGYRGRPLPGLPFDTVLGVVPNLQGRIAERPGSYVTGWIKRGAFGVIGTNKRCARDTVQALIADAEAGRLPTTGTLKPGDIEARVRQRCPDLVDLQGWRAIDLQERTLGRADGRPRRKLTEVAELLQTAAGGERPAPRRYDVVVIGSGLGGLSSAACLAAAGKSVLVLEQHEILGGCSQVFRRGGKWEFDCGVHYVGGCVPGSDNLIPVVLRGLGVEDRIDWSRMDDDGMDTVSFPEHTFRVPTDWDRFAHSLVETFPADAEALYRCVHELREVGEGFDRLNDVPHSVRVMLPLARRPRDAFVIARALEQPIVAMFDRHGLGPQARGALLSLVHLHNTPPSRTPALLVAALMQHYFKAGAYFPTQGGQVLAANLAEVIQANGGTIRTKARVKSIDVESGRVRGVTLQDGEHVRADIVISNADAHRTFFDLIGVQHLRRRTVDRMRRFRRPHSIFSTYIAADIDISALRPATNYILHGRYDVQKTYDILDGGDWDPQGWLAISSPTLKTQGVKHFGTAGHSSIEAFLAVPAEYEFWGGGDPLSGPGYKWSATYARRKNEIEESVMDRVLTALPELDGHVVWQESATPLTHERYTLSRMPYGPENAKDQIGPGRRLSPRTEIDGLFLAGASTVYLYGIAFTLRGGVGTASHILGRDLLGAFRNGEVLGDRASLPDHGAGWDPFEVSRGHALKGSNREEFCNEVVT